MKHLLRQRISEALSVVTGLEKDDIEASLDVPKNSEHGDLAFPCFLLAKQRRQAPPAIASALAKEIVLPDGIESAIALGPFINFRFERSAYIGQVLQEVCDRRQTTSLLSDVKDKKVLVEYSSPNIAKPFHVGHLRATLIGNCLDRVYRFAGYQVESINHLGDWGTQFGFVWAGSHLWGKPEKPLVSDLVSLYRRATALKEEQDKGAVSAENADLPDVNLLARDYFLALERGEDEAVNFWKWCVAISLDYLKGTYKRLDIDFDHYTGESFYSDKLDDIRDKLSGTGALRNSDGALGIDLSEDLGFARISAPDGRSLYLARDIAAAEYRWETFSFSRCLYVVGAPQSLHFKQLKAVLSLLGRTYVDRLEHVEFGHVLGMKTRGSGGFIELNDLLDEAQERALSAYRDQVTKRPEGLDENLVAKTVGLSAIVFSTLSKTRHKDVQFSWDHALEFQGDTGPYLLYAYARINGVRQKAAEIGIKEASPDQAGSLLKEESAFHLSMRIDDFEEMLSKTISQNEPAILANYSLELAKDFSRAYTDLKVIGAEAEEAQARLALFESTRVTLGQCLELLGITPLERM